MPSVSFSGTTTRGPFWDLILKGEKTQTIRKPRKRPFKVDDTLYHYWKMRQPKDKKPVHLIAEAPCISVIPVTLNQLWEDKENAKADGFGSIYEFRDWFYPDWRKSWSYYLFMAELSKIKLTVIKWGELSNILGLFNPEDIEGIKAHLKERLV